MGKYQDIINEILSMAKVVSVTDSAEEDEQAYKPEPILKRASALAYGVPQKYRDMRKIKSIYDYYNDYDEQLFYRQGQFMADFEDDCVYKGEFMRYLPTYQSMTDQQLRGYFTWRTKVRRGIVEETSYSFVFVYIYELLNLIGAASALDGYHKLMFIWEEYKKYEPKINYYLSDWIKDYVIYYDLDTSLISELDGVAAGNLIDKLLNYEAYTPKEITEALNFFSSYNLLRSKFYRDYSDDVDAVVYKSFQALVDYYHKNRKQTFIAKLFGKLSRSPHYMFSSAIFYKKDKLGERVKELSGCDRYIYKNGYWEHEYCRGANRRNKEIGEILKTVDYFMRETYAYSSTVTLSISSTFLYNTIKKTVEDFCAENNRKSFHLYRKKAEKAKRKIEPETPKATPVKVALDPAKFGLIRSAAEGLQKKLIIEEEPAGKTPPKPERSVDGGALDMEEKFVIKALIDNDLDQVNAVLNQNGRMLSVVIDTINEKLFNILNDNAIDFDGAAPYIIEDYLDSLKGLLER